MHPIPIVRCSSLLQHKASTINQIKQVHAQLITNASNSPSLFGKLIEKYCALPPPHATKYAQLVLTHLNSPDVYPLNVLIRCSLPRQSILVFANWVSKASLVFDDFTYIFALGACARCVDLSALWEGKQIHTRILKHGFCWNVMVQTTAVHFYASSNEVLSARKVFEEMHERSSATWNAMIKGYCSQGEKIKERACEALMLFRNMLVDVCGVKPTDTTMSCVLSAASQLGVLETGTCVHGYMEKTIHLPESDVYIGTGLVDMYSKCGSLDSASYIFKKMEEKNVLTWTAMAMGLAVHGEGTQALDLLDDMKACGIKPNEVTFTSLLSACRHAGLVDEGLCLFYSMERYGVTPLVRHYGCIVDLLGRAGHLIEAYEFISGMRVERDAVLWRSLLNACRVHGNVVMGEKVAEVLLHIQPHENCVRIHDASEDYVALSNVYASAERWEDVEMVRGAMKVKGVETKPGCSSVHSLVSNHS
ncbi:hypothetical protein RJ640_012346 [Escallonia rubra]|uniref:Pentatricopeptide repeat-containing protein n=1 Tax=Escallonia rubra TaxID=112253 RepID=A0AA88RR61_9ASTE|nr:hypothetical protein RJ640_012346 [Escallonia rubra]